MISQFQLFRLLLPQKKKAGSETNLFYVDIANVHGVAARRRNT